MTTTTISVEEAQEKGMALLICRSCTALFAVGMRQCPQCGKEDAALVGSPEAEEFMAKTTVHGGASDKTLADQAEVTVTASEDLEDGGVPEPPAQPATSPEAVTVTPGPTLEKPTRRAPHADWVAWALYVDSDLEPEQAEKMLKSALIDQYG